VHEARRQAEYAERPERAPGDRAMHAMSDAAEGRHPTPAEGAQRFDLAATHETGTQNVATRSSRTQRFPLG
jgi:hypothetical protein